MKRTAKALSTIEVRSTKDGTTLKLPVYGEYGPLLVTGVESHEDYYSITHAPTGKRFGWFKKVKDARGCARELANMVDWTTIGENQIAPKSIGDVVLPVVRKWSRETAY